MKILNSSNVAELVNLMLRNSRGTTTSEETEGNPGLIVKEDLSNLVEGGKELSNNLTELNMKNIVTGMLEGVGKILYENVRVSGPSEFDIFVDDSEFLTMIEKVRINGIEFEKSYQYDTTGGSSFSDMFNNHPLQFTVTVWNQVSVYRTKPYTISYDQLASSVRSAEGLTKLIGEIYAVVESTYMQALREAEKRVIMNQMANTAMYRSGANVIDLLAEFKRETGTTCTKQTALVSDAFKRWVPGYLKKLINRMRKPTANYNGANNLINTDDSDRRALMLDDFKIALQTISTANQGTAFGDVISQFKETCYIQNFNECNKIDVVPCKAPTLTSGKHVTEVVIEDIVGFVWDKRGTMISSPGIRAGANRNDFDQWTNYVHNFKLREMTDEGSNAVLLVMHSADATEKAYTITEEDDA